MKTGLVKRIKFPTFKSTVEVYNGADPKTHKQIEKCVGRFSPYETYGGRAWNCGAFIIIHIKDQNKISVCAHEAVHAANFILKNRGCRHKYHDDEVSAYIVERIMREVFGEKLRSGL